jgi:hypothetical protein
LQLKTLAITIKQTTPVHLESDKQTEGSSHPLSVLFSSRLMHCQFVATTRHGHTLLVPPVSVRSLPRFYDERWYWDTGQLLSAP